MTFERFPNPPIKEAIFSVRFKEELSIEQLEIFCSTTFISEKYPTAKKSVIRQINTGAQDQDLSVKNLHDGFVLRTADDGDNIIQARKSHLSYHRVNKYDNWELLIQEFRKVCKELQTIAKSELLIRVLC